MSAVNQHDAKFNVLFLGNGNSARSIMSEAILNRDGGAKFNAFSAGINTHRELDPHAVDLLTQLHFDVSGARAKEWSEFVGDGAPRFDFVFAVCEGSALMPRSVWPGNPMFANWAMPNPAFVEGSEAEIRVAYADTFRMLANRIGVFVSLPLRSLDKLAMQRQLDIIGGQPGVVHATASAG